MSFETIMMLAFAGIFFLASGFDLGRKFERSNQKTRCGNCKYRLEHSEQA